MQGVDGPALESVLRFFYTGEITLDAYNVVGLYDVAMKLEVTVLAAACDAFVSQTLRPLTAMLYYDAAAGLEFEQMMAATLDVVKSFPEESLLSPAFGRMRPGMLRRLAAAASALGISRDLLAQAAACWTVPRVAGSPEHAAMQAAEAQGLLAELGVAANDVPALGAAAVLRQSAYAHQYIMPVLSSEGPAGPNSTPLANFLQGVTPGALLPGLQGIQSVSAAGVGSADGGAVGMSATDAAAAAAAMAVHGSGQSGGGGVNSSGGGGGEDEYNHSMPTGVPTELSEAMRVAAMNASSSMDASQHAMAAMLESGAMQHSGTMQDGSMGMGALPLPLPGDLGNGRSGSLGRGRRGGGDDDDSSSGRRIKRNRDNDDYVYTGGRVPTGRVRAVHKCLKELAWVMAQHSAVWQQCELRPVFGV